MRKAHDKIMRPILNTGDNHIGLAKICLGVTRRVAQRYIEPPQKAISNNADCFSLSIWRVVMVCTSEAGLP